MSSVSLIESTVRAPWLMKVYKAASGVINIISGEIKLNNHSFEFANLFDLVCKMTHSCYWSLLVYTFVCI